MSWSRMFSNVEIEGCSVGSGRIEINGCCIGEEIDDTNYRALVVKQAIRNAKNSNRKTPSAADFAKAQSSVDALLKSRDVTRSFRF